jgi:topoisomerase IV subunit A
VVPEAEVVANTRKGRQVMNVKSPDEAKLCLPVTGDHLAIVGENRKLLVFPMAEVPEMGRGKGVRLQKYKDGGVNDARTFSLAEGLSWTDSADRIFVRPAAELAEWIGARASAGRMVPKGFPRTGKFG